MKYLVSYCMHVVEKDYRIRLDDADIDEEWDGRSLPHGEYGKIIEATLHDHVSS